jgi:DNA-binding CsgD family transcriptional regulator
MKDYGYFSFGGLTLSMHYQPEIIDKMSLDEMLREYGHLAHTSSLSIPTPYIIDYVSKKYIALSSNVEDLVGYPVNHFFDDGLDFLLQITDKVDLNICNEKIVPYNIRFLNGVPKSDHNQYIFTHNYRINAKDGKKVLLYQQSTLVLSPETGLPMYSIGLLSDIGQLKKDTSILHQIVRIRHNGKTSVKEIAFSTEYSPDQHLLSKRELEILKLLAQGLNSKQIGEKLFISESTVVIHRKNMLVKTSSKNVAQLIAYGAKNHLII